MDVYTHADTEATNPYRSCHSSQCRYGHQPVHQEPGEAGIPREEGGGHPEEVYGAGGSGLRSDVFIMHMQLHWSSGQTI